MKQLSLVVSIVLGILGAQSVFAEYGVDDVGNDTSNKTTESRAEMEINEFIKLDAIADMELYYVPYSATKADDSLSEDAPGSAGSVYVGGGVVRFHGNIEMELILDDFTLDHTDSTLSSRNAVETSQMIHDFDETSTTNSATSYFDSASFNSAMTLDELNILAGSDDMAFAYFSMSNDQTTTVDPQAGSTEGQTDFARKMYHKIVLGADTDVERPGVYRGTATLRLVPVPSA